MSHYKLCKTIRERNWAPAVCMAVCAMGLTARTPSLHSLSLSGPRDSSWG
jgi:hypothetical protein